MILADGWHQNCRRMASPNCDQRPPGQQIELLVIHGISVPAGKFGGRGVERLFCNRWPQLSTLRVSAHFFIDRAGLLTQFVSCNKRAWHAGASSWRARARCNDFSVGIELEGADNIAYTDRQYRSLFALVAVLRAAYRSLAAIAGHCHIAAPRKSDPGAAFDWPRLLAAVGLQLDGRR